MSIIRGAQYHLMVSKDRPFEQSPLWTRKAPSTVDEASIHYTVYDDM